MLQNDSVNLPKPSGKWHIAFGLLSSVLVVALIVFVLSAMPNGAYVNTVSADAYPSGQTLNLSVRCRMDLGCYKAYGGTYFTTATSFSKLRKKAEQTCGETSVTAYGNAQLLIEQEKDGRMHYYLLERLEQRNSFLFYGMKATIEDVGHEYMLLLPFHYIDDARISGKIDPKVYLGAEYQLVKGNGGTTFISTQLSNLFAHFYQKGGYTVEVQADGLSIFDGSDVWQIIFRSHGGQWFFLIEWGR